MTDNKEDHAAAPSSVGDVKPFVSTSSRLCFGPFSLRNQGEALYRGEEPVRLGSRARQILSILATRAGEVVPRAVLMAEVWPDTVVVENNLTVHIAAVRQALSDGRDGLQYIVNVPGRGYRFVAHVTERPDIGDTRAAAATTPIPTNLPVRLAPAFGLSTAMADMNDRLQSSQLVTLTGPAGVGKTTLALHVAHAELSAHPDGVWLVDLAPLRDARQIPATVAATMRIELGLAEPEDSLVRALSGRNAIFLLDNCEHLIDAVANLAAMILRACPNVVLLATSREPLRISGEVVYGLEPLHTPPDSTTMTAREALSYSAVQLFVERVSAVTNNFVLSDADAPAAASVCRRLDGLPLAIEFASALVGVFGVAGLAARLDDRFKLIQTDMRGVSHRHRTLTTALDWSYGLLDELERTVLRCLAVFAGGFTVESAAAVVGVKDLGELGGLLARLHSKSLITSDISPSDIRFRLLETTRAYALEKLNLAGEEGKVRLRHAVYFRDLLRKLRLQLGEREGVEGAVELDNIRAALRFAMAPGGDIDIALSLASGALPVWLGLSLVSECQARLREVLALLPPHKVGSSEGWDLEISLRGVELFTTGVSVEAFQKWTTPPASSSSESHTRRPLVGDMVSRWTWSQRNAHAREMREFAEKWGLAVGDANEPYDQVTKAWISGLLSFVLGELAPAKIQLERFLEIDTPRFRRIFLGRSGYDRASGARSRLGLIQCLLGDLELGLHEARASEEVARATGKALPLCEAKQLSHIAFEIALLDPADLEASLDELLEIAHNHGLGGHFGTGLGLKGIFFARQGRTAAAEDLLRQSVDQLRRTGTELIAPWFHGALGHVIGLQGRVDEGLAVTSDWRRRDRNPNGWCAPEFERLVGSLHALNGDRDQAQRSLTDALALAENQGAVGWSQRIQHDLEKMR